MQVLTFEQAVKIGVENSVNPNTQRNNLQLSEVQSLSGYAGTGTNRECECIWQRNDGNFFNSMLVRWWMVLRIIFRDLFL